MCEELEQQYEALRREYQQYIADRLPKEELAVRNEMTEKRGNSAHISFLF